MTVRALRVETGAGALEVRVRESRRARRLTIKVSAEHGPEVVVPAGTGDREIDRALRRNREWIGRKVEEMADRAASQRRLGLDRPGFVWVGARPVPIRLGGGTRPVARLAAGSLLLGGPAEEAGAAIERWYRRQARAQVSAVVAREGARLGVRPQRVSVRDQRTRWGSCTARGTLSFSWRLLIAPERVLDYVVVHELCHLRELNHSPAFWSLLSENRPDWRQEAGWLREHGSELGMYKPRLAK